MTRDLGWSRTALSGVVTLRAVMMGLLGPIIGRLADHRSGPRLLFVVGGLMAGASLLLLPLVGQLWHFYLAFGVLWGVGQATFGGQIVSGAVVSKWFIRWRGRATSIYTAGISLGGVVFVPLSVLLIAHLGWKGAWAVLGLLTWLLIVPISAKVMRRRPENIGLLPDGVRSNPHPYGAISVEGNVGTVTPSSGEVTEVSWTLREAVRTPTLWLLLLAFNFMGMPIGAVVLHQVPYMTDKGFSLGVASSLAVLFSAFALIAKLPWGLLSERYDVRYVTAACFTIGAIGLVFLVIAGSAELAIVFAVVFGLGAGGQPVLQNVVMANYYGREFQGTIRGTFAPINALGMGLSPLFAAWVYDVTGSYDRAFLLLAVGISLATLFILLARPPVHRRQTTATAVG